MVSNGLRWFQTAKVFIKYSELIFAWIKLPILVHDLFPSSHRTNNEVFRYGFLHFLYSAMTVFISYTLHKKWSFPLRISLLNESQVKATLHRKIFISWYVSDTTLLFYLHSCTIHNSSITLTSINEFLGSWLTHWKMNSAHLTESTTKI